MGDAVEFGCVVVGAAYQAANTAIAVECDIGCLQRAAADQKASPAATGGDAGAAGTTDVDDESPTVGLGQRAFPLIELLQWTQQEEGFVLWEADRDF